MSGGSYDYAYLKVDDMAHNLRQLATDPLRRAFHDHLLLVSQAMRAVEWVDSHDWGKGEEAGPVRAVLAPGAELAAAITMAKETLAMLEHAIAVATGGKGGPTA